MREDIKSISFHQLVSILVQMGYPKFRAEQVFFWLHKKHAITFDQMLNLPQSLRSCLNDQFYISALKTVKRLESIIDGTIKYLYAMPFSQTDVVETVLMKYHYGYSVCISSQIGCKMGCEFCASTKTNFIRNLKASEMLEQVYQTEQDIGQPINRIVVMGIGEPLENYDNLVQFIDIISDHYGRSLGRRHITVSTCGLVDKIHILALRRLPIQLSISLHASNDAVRRKLMPIANKYSIEQLRKECIFYIEQTGRQITFEYAMIRDVNDHIEHAQELVSYLKGLLAHVNLIPINPIREREYLPSSREHIMRFANILRRNGIPVTIRRQLGQDIHAACGQLRRDSMKYDNAV